MAERYDPSLVNELHDELRGLLRSLYNVGHVPLQRPEKTELAWSRAEEMGEVTVERLLRFWHDQDRWVTAYAAVTDAYERFAGGVEAYDMQRIKAAHHTVKTLCRDEEERRRASRSPTSDAEGGD